MAAEGPPQRGFPLHSHPVPGAAALAIANLGIQEASAIRVFTLVKLTRPMSGIYSVPLRVLSRSLEQRASARLLCSEGNSVTRLVRTHQWFGQLVASATSSTLSSEFKESRLYTMLHVALWCVVADGRCPSGNGAIVSAFSTNQRRCC